MTYCLNCDSENVEVQKYDPAESEEISGIWILAVVLLCNDCGWGFNCTGTKDHRVKKITGKPPV